MTRARRRLETVTAAVVVAAWAALYLVVVTTAPLAYDPATESAAKVNREFAPDDRRDWGLAMHAELAGPAAVFFVPAFAAGWAARSFGSGLQAGIWAGIASLPLTYALWLHEALRLYAIDGGLLWFGDGAPEGENLTAAVFWALRFAPLLGLPFAVIGAAIGARGRPPVA
jgi:hypothetical protein